ncbi:MAG: hypothetical protein ABIT09_03730 [Croceibacterium sp.]
MHIAKIATGEIEDEREELSAPEPDFEAQMAAAREVMARRKRALQELAK